jgi:hypothetical protein
MSSLLCQLACSRIYCWSYRPWIMLYRECSCCLPKQTLPEVQVYPSSPVITCTLRTFPCNYPNTPLATHDVEITASLVSALMLHHTHGTFQCRYGSLPSGVSVLAHQSLLQFWWVIYGEDILCSAHCMLRVYIATSTGWVCHFHTLHVLVKQLWRNPYIETSLFTEP